MNFSLLARSALCSCLLLTACDSSQGPTSETPSTKTETTQSETTTTASAEAPASVDAYLTDLENRGFEGTVLIREGDETTSKGFGFADRDSKVPNNTETIFDIGSVTKQFTGAAIVRLEMDGLLTVEDPISNYVDGLPEGYEDVTLHHLLTHSSGIRDGGGGDYDQVELPAFVAALAPLETTPGDTYAYSNSGYSLLTAAIERVTGDSYEAYLNEALFKPADMQSTGYLLADWSEADIAIGYEGESGLNTEFARPNELPWDDDGPYWYLRGNGGIMSSAEDMMRWHDALVGDTILDAEAKEKLFAPHIPEGEGAPSSYGYGWSIVSSESAGTVIAHNGGNGIFMADFVRFVDADLTIFMASNNIQPEFDNVAYDLANILLDTDEFSIPENPCQPTAEALATFTELDELPDDAAGQTMTELLTLLAEGDRVAWKEFAEASVADDFGISPEEFAEEAMLVQADLGPFEITRVLQDGPQTFHVSLKPADADELVISGHLTDDETSQFSCIEVNGQ